MRIRFSFLCAVFICSSAFWPAYSCTIPRHYNADLRHVIACLRDEISDLKKEQSRLWKIIENQDRINQDLLQEIDRRAPKDYRSENGRTVKRAANEFRTAIFKVTQRNENINSSTAIPKNILEDFCAKDGGCTISLISTTQPGPAGGLPQKYMAGPCAFQYDISTGGWARDKACSELGQPFGQDGNGSPTGGSGAEVILATERGCTFTDSEPRNKMGTSEEVLGHDHAKGLLLLATAQTEEDQNQRFLCELKIE